MKYAIVTPYFKESTYMLERCIRSVRQQSVLAEHILVADGYPQDWIDDQPVRHLKLDRAHGDYGNTPRAMGALMAIAEQYDAIGLLDADNWLEPNHVETCLVTAANALKSGRADYVIARRWMRRPDESVIPVCDLPIDEHVDTNCFFFLPGSYHMIPSFGTMAKELSPVCDRIFYQALRGRGLVSTVCPVETVNYHCIWASVYLAIGEIPPVDSKPNIDSAAVQQWLNGLSVVQVDAVQRMAGMVP